MTFPPLKTNPMLKIFSESLIRLPSPSNLNYMWNYGSLLGVILVSQITTGLILSMHYSNSTFLAFSSVSHIMRDVNYGWVIRATHANSASLFFMFIYLHLGRNLYYKSFKLIEVWVSGVTLLLILMATAFLGYVLPWGQMSFWGATVITNFFSAIPIIGSDVVLWLWGGFAVSSPTLSRFFSLHFLLPFIMVLLILIHLLFLHQTGSNNPLGTPSNYDKIVFHPYFSFKDILGFLIWTFVLMMLSLYYTWELSDPENFSQANPLITPLHIQPEWYFLFAYAILRSIPNKLGGVIALVLSVVMFYFIPFIHKKDLKPTSYNLQHKILFWSFINIIIILTWIGACPVDPPYIFIGQISTLLYFSFFFTLSL